MPDERDVAKDLAGQGVCGALQEQRGLGDAVQVGVGVEEPAQLTAA